MPKSEVVTQRSLGRQTYRRTSTGAEAEDAGTMHRRKYEASSVLAGKKQENVPPQNAGESMADYAKRLREHRYTMGRKKAIMSHK